MKETEVAPGEPQGDETKEESRKMTWVQKIVGIVGFLFFVLIGVGAILRKCGG